MVSLICGRRSRGGWSDFSLVFVTATVIFVSVILYLIVAGVVREQIDQRLDTQIDGLRGSLFLRTRTERWLSQLRLDGPPFDRRGAGVVLAGFGRRSSHHLKVTRWSKYPQPSPSVGLAMS